MNLTIRSALLVAALSTTMSALAQQPQPVKDPIPKKIPKGDITVAVRDFVHLPRTEDTGKPPGTNDAYARIQYLLPARDGSGRLFINDTRGVLYVTDASGKAPAVYLDLRKEDVGFDISFFPNESGLAGFAFHPEFAKKGAPGYGKLYVAYSTPSDTGKANYRDDDAANHESVVREWTTADPAANAFKGTSRELFRIGQFANNHNVGTIAFNPNAKDAAHPDYGVLYVSLGDGGGANDPRDNGQGRTTPLGSIMRIKPLPAEDGRAYSIPADNPFVGRQDVAPEIWAYGFRHPQQFSWDTAGDGKMLIAEFGQSQVEEINLGVKGGNYGWQTREGTFWTAAAVKGDKAEDKVYPILGPDAPSFLYPVAQYDHDEGRGVASGYVYRGSRVPELRGKYVFADLVAGRLFYVDADTLKLGTQSEIKELRLTFDGKEKPLIDVAGFPNTYTSGKRADLRMGIDDAGELYLLTKGDGWVRTLDSVSPAKR